RGRRVGSVPLPVVSLTLDHRLISATPPGSSILSTCEEYCHGSFVSERRDVRNQTRWTHYTRIPIFRKARQTCLDEFSRHRQRPAHCQTGSPRSPVARLPDGSGQAFLGGCRVHQMGSEDK